VHKNSHNKIMIKNIREKLEKMIGQNFICFVANSWIVIFSEMFNSLMSDVDSFLSVRWCKEFRKPYCELNKVLEKL